MQGNFEREVIPINDDLEEDLHPFHKFKTRNDRF